jgi:hypothetical protein
MFSLLDEGKWARRSLMLLYFFFDCLYNVYVESRRKKEASPLRYLRSPLPLKKGLYRFLGALHASLSAGLPGVVAFFYRFIDALWCEQIFCRGSSQTTQGLLLALSYLWA